MLPGSGVGVGVGVGAGDEVGSATTAAAVGVTTRPNAGMQSFQPTTDNLRCQALADFDTLC